MQTATPPLRGKHTIAGIVEHKGRQVHRIPFFAFFLAIHLRWVTRQLLGGVGRPPASHHRCSELEGSLARVVTSRLRQDQPGRPSSSASGTHDGV